MTIESNRQYRHYKGNLYRVLDLGKHTETEEDMVIYKAEEKDQIWIRPLAMFEETVIYNDVEQPRFKLIEKE